MKRINWSGLFSYDVQSVNNNVPASAGMYLLLKKVNGNWQCFYIGKSEDLNRRFKEHLNPNEVNECVRSAVASDECAYVFAEVLFETDRSRIEKYLYDHYSPKCNIQDPGGNSLEVNLP